MSHETKESSVHLSPLSAGDLILQPNFRKGGAWQDLNVYRRVAGKEGHDIFQGGGGSCNFYIKNKLKSEIFNDKKSLSKNIFLCHN